MSFKTHGTVTVPIAGLKITVSTRAEEPESVSFGITRYGMPFGVVVTHQQAEAIATALLDALNSHAAGVAP